MRATSDVEARNAAAKAAYEAARRRVESLVPGVVDAAERAARVAREVCRTSGTMPAVDTEDGVTGRFRVIRGSVLPDEEKTDGQG